MLSNSFVGGKVARPPSARRRAPDFSKQKSEAVKPRFQSVGWFGLGLLLGFVALFPGALGRLGDEALLERGGGNADVADFAAGQERLHALQVRHELALGDRGDVRADTAGFLGLTRAPNDAALHRAFAGQFTNACHK